MPVDATVRVSFQSSPLASRAAHLALSSNGPFDKIGTALYACRSASEVDVASAFAELAGALVRHSAVVDHVFVSLVRVP